MLPCNTTGHNNKSNVLNIEKKSIKKITIQKNLAYNYIKCFALHNYRVISNNKSHIQFNLWGQKQTTNIFFSIHIISLSVCSIYQIILFPLFFLHQMNTIQMSFHQTSGKHTHVKRSFTSPDLYFWWEYVITRRFQCIGKLLIWHYRLSDCVAQ